MKVVFNYACAAALFLGAAPASAEDPPDDLVDLDGDGDIDDADRAALEAAEVIQIDDPSEGRKLSESSRAVTVLDLEKARERAADLGEVLARVQGVQVRRSGSLGSAERISIDGLQDQQIRFFVDGVPLDYTGWGLGISSIPVHHVQRVDIYRGVVPIRFGSDSLGGVIDLVTDPSWASRASFSYQVGSFGQHRLAAGGRVRDESTGLALGLSLFADRARNDYPIEVEIPNEVGRPEPATVRRFHDGYTAGGAIVEGGIVRRGPVERALLRAFHTQYGKDLQHNPFMSLPYGDASYGGHSRGGSADVSLASGAWRGRLVAGAARSVIDFEDVGTSVFSWRGERIRERPIPGEYGDATDQRITEIGMFARATAERDLGPHHRVRLAVAPTAARRTGKDFLDTNPEGRDPIEARREVWQLVLGVEHEARGARFENTAFGKYYHLGTDAEEARPGFVFVPISTSIDRFGVGDSLRVRLSRELSLKASYEWATRLPSVEELFGDGILIQENLQLAPERSHNLNLGAQVVRAADSGAWSGEVNAFARLAENLMILTGNDRVFSYQNVYAARFAGVQGAGAWRSPGGWLALEATATFQDIRNVSSEGTFGAFLGDRIPNRPWLLGSAGGSVRRRGTLRPGDELSLFAQSRYVRWFYLGWEGLGLASSKAVVPSQLVHGAGITYATRGARPVTATLEVQNLTDARAYDDYRVQRPGRALYFKLSAEL